MLLLNNLLKHEERKKIQWFRIEEWAKDDEWKLAEV